MNLKQFDLYDWNALKGRAVKLHAWINLFFVKGA